ncbi:alpha/beta hydrolase-fold protein [Streptomyces justiciae]|uniref:Alpha/beta hydrolase-fold protein n=1 Tax=Streptomyces justiciae TaxID=2780140 RepID=A0ABU3M5G2_9ACTN|nr:alpha/beta hydrolase-fold protein [Streptomyces justiciae]MDT7846741.1 alpha/beta hydrolase-fold protein [Streptomyces justiciae]
MDRRTLIAGSAAAGGVAMLGSVAYGATSDQKEQKESNSGNGNTGEVTAITKVFGDGQKLIAVAIEYDSDIDDSALSTNTFTVTGRTVTKVYANEEAALADRGRDGRYVIVELSPDDEAAALWVTQQGSGGGGSSASPSPSGSASSSSGDAGGGVGAGGPKVGDSTPGGTIVAAEATLTQKGTVTTTRGSRYPASDATLTTNSVVNLIVDDFKQFTYDDPATGQTLTYNLFVPKDYNPRKRYPLVLFMHDASVVNVATQGPLVQGLGAVCWASDADQARHESFVLAPAYGSVVVDDTYEPSTLFDATANLVEAVTKKYSIDPERRYTTGQSMGAMMSLGLNIKYPDLFAAAYIVAGQWPSDVAAPLADKKLWIVVSQDDDKAYSGENAITKVIAAKGTKVGTAVWDGQSTAAQFAADVRTLEKQKAPVNYASFQTGTTVESGSSTSAHMGTWRIAYTIPGIRDWIMRQSL